MWYDSILSFVTKTCVRIASIGSRTKQALEMFVYKQNIYWLLVLEDDWLLFNLLKIASYISSLYADLINRDLNVQYSSIDINWQKITQLNSCN